MLAEEPFCRTCLDHGLEVASDQVDHIVPLYKGGSDERGNKQALCKPCHLIKSTAERIEARQRRVVPD